MVIQQLETNRRAPVRNRRVDPAGAVVVIHTAEGRSTPDDAPLAEDAARSDLDDLLGKLKHAIQD